ncbi:MAG: winged helix-turn-helix transcriptional regulator [Euryarchaeota archaeon]|nr:winged helix-turn-helix transcriptional regulator [Euryarchaeota archaeon]
MENLLYFLFAATRGGATRRRIVEVLKKSPMNANQLATHLGVDYRTVMHHLRILEKNNIVTVIGEKYGQVYFLSQAMEEYYPYLASIMKEGTHA